MISKLTFRPGDPSVVPWWEKVPFLKKIRDIEFTPGLNILFGPNGSGKSTVITAIAKMMHAHQGGSSTVTEMSVREVWPFTFFRKDGDAKPSLKSGVSPSHDGQSVIYMNPSSSFGIIGGAFDEDFMEKGLVGMLQDKSSSSGQGVIGRLNDAFKDSREGSKPVFRFTKDGVNTVWQEALVAVEKFFEPQIDRGRHTILLDEPDRSLDIPNQTVLWGEVQKNTRVQLIVATHSLFSLNIEGANYIETEKGYLKKCLKAMKGLRQ